MTPEHEEQFKQMWFNYILRNTPELTETGVMHFVNLCIAKSKTEDIATIIQAESEVQVFLLKTQRGFQKVFDSVE